MMTKLTLGSIFDGSGGFPLGGLLSGITPIWASEIEPFPIRVTSKRIPIMKHFGDVRTLNGSDLPPVDIITFGSPCTDMSVAGKRAGLDGEQSVLFYEAIRIIKEMRGKTNGRYPRFAVWENVPGAFSSSKGEDFKAVLNAFIDICHPRAEVPSPENGKWPYADTYMGDGWSLAYRTVDAQYFGVAQRRRRIYLVADFTGECAGEILFKSEGMSGYSSQSSRSWQGSAADVKGSVSIPICFEPGAVSRLSSGHFWNDSSCCLRAAMGDNQLAVAIDNHPTDSRVKIDESGMVQTLTSRMGTGGGNVPLVMNERQYALTVGENIANTLTGTDYKGTQCVFESHIQEEKSIAITCDDDQSTLLTKAYGICSDASNSMRSANPLSGIYEANTSRTLDATGGNPSCNQGGIAVVSLQGSMIGRLDRNGPLGDGINENVSFTLNTVDRHGVVYAIDRETFNCGQNFARNLGINEDGIASTLNAQGPSAVAQPTSSNLQMKAESQCLRQNGAVDNDVNSAKAKYQNNIVEHQYTVRRLTPAECALLQGFPEDWCKKLETIEPTEDDIDYWTGIFETHRKVMGKSTTPKSRKQVIKWLQNPYSDAAEYKMWGNGVALPCVHFVLSGIVWVVDRESAEQ